MDEIVKKALAEYLGIEPEDIEDEDSLENELHMRPSDLSDFLGILQEKGVDSSRVDLTEVETVGDLIEELGNEEYL